MKFKIYIIIYNIYIIYNNIYFNINTTFPKILMTNDYND